MPRGGPRRGPRTGRVDSRGEGRRHDRHSGAQVGRPWRGRLLPGGLSLAAATERFYRWRAMKVRGGCHCMRVRFEAEVPEPPVPALDCNCSICRMTGFLHVMVPHRDFEILTGGDALTSYRFGTGAAEHLFCKDCGVKSFYQPRSHPDSWSLNANCFDEPLELAIQQFDGRNWQRAKADLDAQK